MATGKTWKKQLFRVQQMADQKLGRSEKTEVLNEELQSLEKRVEVISKACHATSKRLKDLFGGIPPDERKLKKMPESGLSFSLIESGNLLDQTSLGQAMKQCGDVEGFLAKERLVLEMEIEQHVMAPLNSVVEVDVPAINKQKRHLKQNILDMDGAKNRHVSAVKAHQEGKINASKVESIREEMEEAINKVEQCRDQHATDTYSFVARETEFSKVLLELMTLQMDYHRRAWERLQAVVPEIQEQIESSVHMPVFGQSLAEHLKSTNRKIAMVIEQSVLALLQCGMEEEGLFRIAGGASKVKKLRAFLDSNMVDMEEFENDPHTIAGTFKQYLRELPEPLLTYELYDEWMQAAHLPQEERLAGLWTVLGKLPEDNYNNLRYLVKFLAKLAEKSDVNKMTTSNIAIVMGPNLLWPAGENGPSVLSTGMQSGILEAMVSNADWFFQGDIDFTQTSRNDASPSPSRRHQLGHWTESGAKEKNANKVQPTLQSGLSQTHSTLVAPLQKPPLPPNTRASFLAEMTCDTSGSDQERVSKRFPHERTPSSEREQAGVKRHSLTGYGILSSSSSQPDLIVAERASLVKAPAGDHVRCRNGATSSAAVGNGMLLSHTVSEPSGCNATARNQQEARLCSRAITPPPRPTPPKSIHSDMYNTVFALQSLGNGWSDYLTRVRGLWDGHLNKAPIKEGSTEGNSSVSEQSGEGGGGTTEEQFDGTGTSNDYPTTAREVQELPYPVNPPSNSHVDGNLPTNPFTSLTVESAENNTGASPKQPRKKKHAPQPPQPKAAIPTDDQKVVIREKTNSLGRPVPVIPPEGVKSNSLGRLESMKTTQRPDKPAGITVPITDVPVSPHSPLSPGLQKERPRGPPPERPTAPPPDKPPHSSSPERQQLSDIPEGSSETKVPPEKPTPPAVIISKTVSDKSALHSDKSEPTNEKPAAVMEKSGPPVERQMSDKKPAPPKDKPEKPAPPTDKSGDSLDKVIPAPSEKPPEKPPPPTERPTVSHDRSEKPEKPDKPPAPSLISSISFRASEKPERPAKPVLTEKPILEEKPILKSGDYVPGHQRQLSGGGSGQRPPRPTPPPPPRPE